MPYKSKAQEKFFNAAAARGDLSQEMVDRWNAESKGKMKGKPEKVKPITKPAPKRRK